MTKQLCGRCELLPSISKDATRLFMWPPIGHTQAKLTATIKQSAALERVASGIGVDVAAHDLTVLLSGIDGALTRSEQADTHCLLSTQTEPSLAEFGGVTSLRKLIALSKADWLLDVLESNRLSTHFQPIVDAKSPSTPFAHECLLRWTDIDGSLKSPVQLFETARDADLLFQLDRQARELNIRNAVAAGVTSKIFLNFTPTAIYDPRNCLKATMSVIKEVGLSPSDVVFEVIETERVKDSEHLKEIMDYYKSHGFGVALDDLGSGHSTLQLLGVLRPNYVKLDMTLVRDVHQDRFKSEVVEQIIGLAHRFDIKVVAEGVEFQPEAVWLRTLGVDYMQGYYFAKPAAEPVVSF